MKRAGFQFFIALLLGGALGAAEEAGAPAVKLTGIASLQTKKCVLLEIVKAGPGKAGPVIRPILSEGDRLGEIEVIAINDQAGQVKLNVAGKDTVLTLESPGRAPAAAKPADGSPAPSTSQGAYSFQLRGANRVQVFEIYQRMSGRTLLRSQSLPPCQLDLRSDTGLPAGEAVKALDTALAEKGIAMEPYGDKFVVAIAKPDVERLSALLVPPVPAATASPGRTKEAMIPAGDIRFQEADLSQFLEVYQEITGRTLLRSPFLPNVKVTVQTQTPLTRAETVNMCDTLLALNNISMVPQDDKFVFVMPSAQLHRLTALLARLSLAPLAQSAALTPVASDKVSGQPTIAPSAVQFANADLSQVLEVYQTLTGRQVQPASNVPPIKITLRAQTPLTRHELIYAFDMVLGLNNLALLPQAENSNFKLVLAAELDRKPNSN